MRYLVEVWNPITEQMEERWEEASLDMYDCDEYDSELDEDFE